MKQLEDFLSNLPIQHWVHNRDDKKVWELTWVTKRSDSDTIENYFNYAQELVEAANSDSEEEMRKAKFRIAIRMIQIILFGMGGYAPGIASAVNGITSFPSGESTEIDSDYEYWGTAKRLMELKIPKDRSVVLDVFGDASIFPPEYKDRVYAIKPKSVTLMRPVGCVSWYDETPIGVESIFSIRVTMPFPVVL